MKKKKLHGVKRFNWHWRHWIFPALILALFLFAYCIVSTSDYLTEVGMTWEEYYEVQNNG